MMLPPATAREYWDRILKLHAETDGNFSTEQIKQSLGLTIAELNDIADLVNHNSFDHIDAYEAARDSAGNWMAHVVAESYAEAGVQPSSADPGCSDRERVRALDNLHSTVVRERGALDINDAGTSKALNIKYAALNRALRAAQMRELLHSFDGN